MKNKSIQMATTNEIIRILLFILYYIALIGLGAYILWGSYWAVYHGIFDIIPSMSSLRGIIIVFLSLIGLCLLSIMIGIYLVKPLFSFTKNLKETRIEITENDCPELFTIIYEIADKTRCQRPKHVYLSPDVNACVFYDTNFWSIFFPVKKNLEIGLGLFDGVSIIELKSILAHEFGHFSQNTMKVGSSVSITNTVLYNLVYSDDAWDRFVDRWCVSDVTSIIRFFGILTRSLTNYIKRLTNYIFNYVQVGYLRLSRYMEYDADNMSCSIFGPKNLVSALCKIDALSKKDSLYQEVLSSMLQEKKFPRDYFESKKIFYHLLPFKDIPNFSYVDVLTKSARTNNRQSKVNFKNIWTSHPSLEERIANAYITKYNVINETRVSAWNLIPAHIQQKVSDFILSIVQKKYEGELETLSDQQCKEWTQNEITQNFMDERIRPFFTDSLYQIDLDVVNYPIPLTSPFTETNAIIIAEFKVARNDWQTLIQIINKEIKVKKVQYDGIIYTPNKIPIDKAKKEADSLYSQVVKINSDIFYYIKSKLTNDEQQIFSDSYRALFYAQYLEKCEFPNLINNQNALLEELNLAYRRDENEYAELCNKVCEFETLLKQFICKLQIHKIASYLGDDSLRNVKEYMNIQHNSSSFIDNDALNEMFGFVNYLIDIQKYLNNIALRTICTFTVNVLDEK